MSPQNPTIVPMLTYEDGLAAIAWLAAAFGFEERARLLAPDGSLVHGELTAGDGVIMLATGPAGYQSPRRHREQCAAAQRWSATPWVINGVLIYVDDVDRHYERAREAGAVILSGLEDGGVGRRYRAEDLEGQRWMFLQRSAG